MLFSTIESHTSQVKLAEALLVEPVNEADHSLQMNFEGISAQSSPARCPPHDFAARLEQGTSAE
jgi:hypothetical protein